MLVILKLLTVKIFLSNFLAFKNKHYKYKISDTFYIPYGLIKLFVQYPF